MPIDPTIALSAGQGVTQPTNPLQMAGQVQALSNAQANNRLINTNADVAQQGLATNQQKAIAGIAVSALSQYDPNNPSTLVQALHSGIDRAVQAGAIPAQQAQMFYNGIGQSNDPGHLIQMVRQTALQAIDPSAALTRIYGAPATMTNGQFAQPGVMNDPFMGGGFAPSGPSVRQMLTPAEKAQPVTRIGPNNQPGTVPLGTTVDPYGNPVGGGTGGGAPIPTTYPAAGGPTTTAPAAPAGFNPTSPPADFVPNQTAFIDAQKDIGPANVRIQNLQEARNALALTNSGPGEATIQKVRAFMQARGMPDFFTGQSDAATALATANKYLLKYAAGTAGNTDAGRAIAIDSNANTGQPQPATLNIIKRSIGDERLKMAATQNAPDPTGAGFLAHVSSYTSKFDPRAFSADLYSPQELLQIQKTLKTPADQAKFYNGLAEANRLGMISLPNQNATPQPTGPVAPQ